MNAAPSRRSTPRIAVIGAGAFGGWTAYHLLRRGAQVTLIDAWGPGNARASSGGESRVIRGLYGADRIYIELVARSFELWREAEERFGSRLLFTPGGLWMFGEDDRYARDALPLMRKYGLDMDRLDIAEAERRYPLVNFEGVQSVFFEPGAGFLLARRACALVLENFVAEGGTWIQAKVDPVGTPDGSLHQLRVSDGTIVEADAWVFACGPWLGELFPDFLGDRIVPTRQEILYFGVPPELAADYARLPVWLDFQERIFYGIPGTEDRGFKIADDTRGVKFDPTHGDRTPSATAIADARERLGQRFPALRDAPLLESRVCQYENSPDGHFIFDRHPGAQNVWLLGGGSGHGFKLGPALGERVAAQILDESVPDMPFSLDRFRHARERSTQFEPGPE